VSQAADKPRIRSLAVLVAVVLFSTGLGGMVRPAAAQTTVDVTVTVLRYIEDAAPDPFGDHGDYYAGVCWPDSAGFLTCNVQGPNSFLVNHEKTTVHQAGVPDVSPFWTLTRSFDRTAAFTARFTLLIWDHDPAINAPDDVMDINPTDGVVTLTFLVDLFTGDWIETSTPFGSIPANSGFARGDGDTETSPGWQGPGGEAGRVLFDISLSDDGDGDDDGIPDGMERTAIRDANGTVVASLAALGADPCRKTVLVEADFMESASVGHSHRPKSAAVDEVRRAFDDATMVPARADCPYAPAGTPPRPGINLVVDVDDAVPEQGALGGSLAAACSTGLPAVRDAAGFFDPDRRPYFHYSLWAHDPASGATNAGLQCGGTRDFLVSLGSWSKICVGPGADNALSTMPAGDDVVNGLRIDNGANRTCESTAAFTDRQVIPVGTGPADDSVGTVREQSATFMHELGHALGLGHGGPRRLTQTGNSEFNYKPDYLSVMNYLFSTDGIFRLTGGVPTSRIDYSSSKLLTLDESNLNENTAIGPGNDRTAWFDANGRLRGGPVTGPFDWDFDTGGAGPFEASVPVDVNGSRRCVGAGAGTLQTTPAAMSDDTTNGARTAVVAGPDNTCQTLTPAAGDRRLLDADRPCVATGGDDVLTTVPLSGSDDTRQLDKWIALGGNGICDTTASTGLDFQSTPVGTSEPTVPLTGSVDWTGLDYSAGLGGVGGPLLSPGSGPDITAEEALQIQSFWRDLATVPGVTVPAEVPLPGPIPASFTEPVEAVTSSNVVLRRAGAPSPLPATLECRDGGGGLVGCELPSVASVWVSPVSPLIPGEHYELSVNPPGVRPVTDPAGNPVTPTVGSFRGSLNETEQSSAARYEWQVVKDANAAGGTYTRDHLAGAAATYTFAGTAITWYTITGPDQGAARVLIDGQLVATLDQYDATTSHGVPRTFAGLAPGAHTITIEATGQAKQGATDAFVSIDAFRVEELLVDTPDVDYAWQRNSAFEDPGRVEYVRSDLARSRTTFTFRGTGVTLWTVEGPSHGRFEVLIDGKSAGVFDSYAATTTYGVPVPFGQLPDAEHTLTVVVRGTAPAASTGTFVAVDGWSVQ
jgi:hypothetical protein